MKNNLTPGDRSYQREHAYSAMEAFDRLPKAVRETLRASDHNWSAAQVYHHWKRPKAKRSPEFQDADTIVRFIRESDRIKHMKDAASGLVAPMFTTEANNRSRKA